MSERYGASVTISYEALAELLGLPEGARITLAMADGKDMLARQLYLVVSHPALPPVLEGQMPHEARDLDEIKATIGEAE